ncbi:MAG TPA: hypothetical protein PLR88_02325 [Bacteroidales bacterium]|mgnify:CR=1 FL=1|nr:hypothetical protein [Bacteroidales bacterium]
MKNFEGKLAGILGTIVIHLLALVIFMSLQIRSLKKDLSNVFEVAIAPMEELTPAATKENKVELPASTVENVLRGDEEMMNIARNLANKPDPKINPEDYIDKVKEELIKSGQLGANNFIDDQKRQRSNASDENVSVENKSSAKAEKDKSDNSQEMASNYKGPTRIYYELAGRTHTYLPIPIYKCQGSGKVVLSIEVNQNGDVEKATIIASQSTTSDPCLVETALTTAEISRFNSDISAPKIQTGTLSYHFVAQ